MNISIIMGNLSRIESFQLLHHAFHFYYNIALQLQQHFPTANVEVVTCEDGPTWKADAMFCHSKSVEWFAEAEADTDCIELFSQYPTPKDPSLYQECANSDLHYLLSEADLNNLDEFLTQQP